MMEFGMFSELQAWKYCDRCGGPLEEVLYDIPSEYDRYTGRPTYWVGVVCSKGSNFTLGYHTATGYTIPEEEYLRRKNGSNKTNNK